MTTTSSVRLTGLSKRCKNGKIHHNTGRRIYALNYLEKVGEKRADKQSKQHKQAVLNAFSGLSNDIRTLLESLDKTGAKRLDKDFVEAVKTLTGVAGKLESIKITSDNDIKEALTALAYSLSRIDVRPVVNVPPPKVEITEREIDFKPLIDKLQPVKVQPEVTDYRAQDMDSETDPNIQFIGFVDAKGAWYIIQNDMMMNTLRYKFGKKSYASNWKNRAKLAYRLYNEALDEVSA